MSLLDAVDGARLAVSDEDVGLAYVWYGSATVFVYDEKGAIADEFKMSTAYDRQLDVNEVYDAIKTHQREIYEEES